LPYSVVCKPIIRIENESLTDTSRMFMKPVLFTGPEMVELGMTVAIMV